MADTRKTVLVTGCTPGGIGHSLAREFNSHGLRVFATTRKAGSTPDLAAEGIVCLECEMTSSDSITKLKNQISGLTNGKLDYLVNNAGRNYTVPALDFDMSEVEATFRVNVFAVMQMCQTFAPLLIAAKGTIVQIGSVAGVTPYVFGSAYNSSKAALHQYSNTLRVELAPFGVQVVTIITGGIKSNIARTDRSLPSNSVYLPVEEEYLRRVKHSQEGAMPNEVYARSVARQVLVKHPKFEIWEGAKVWMVWIGRYILGRTVENFIMSRMFNLWKLYPAAGGKPKSA